jgi:tRNA U34 5-methylaminomethyl-2-thiouridine-forming methyltransferase MnmC
MQQQLFITNDGSSTIFMPGINEHYHSVRGAISESRHVYINAGFDFIQKDFISILEIGFGTGLNALLTFNESKAINKKVYYVAIESYPLEETIWKQMNYSLLLDSNSSSIYNSLHVSDWDKEVKLDNLFSIKKIRTFLNDYKPDKIFDLIYFDAFAPDIQPELWTKEVFNKMETALNNNGVLVTYSAKGIVKQNLRSAGFNISRLKGAAGKRHMLRALKTTESHDN